MGGASDTNSETHATLIMRPTSCGPRRRTPSSAWVC